MSNSHGIPTTINGGNAPHHRGTVSNMTTASDFPDILRSDELAANLIKCATYVKIGESQHPLLRQTINDLTFFVTGKHVAVPSTSSNGVATSQFATPPIISHPSPASSVLSKKSVSQLASNMITKLGLQHPDDNSSVVSGSVSVRTEAHKSASSVKHAEHARSDIQRTLGSSSNINSSSRVVTSGDTTISNRTPVADKPSSSKKPPFQRPTNTSSSLIANGWIEQQRRSKLRVVWKEVLASLVEGRKPGEDTTLWIQREYYSQATNKMELEALHQIPIKLIRQISYQDYTSDHRFLIKVHNMHEDFIFRCEKSEEAAQNWVITIRSVIDLMKDQKRPQGVKTPIRATLDQMQQQQQQQQKQIQRERQISNESSSSFNDEKKAPEHSSVPAAHPIAHQQQQPAPKTAPPVSKSPPTVASAPGGSSTPQMSVGEMRAIAHGAGIQTHGMERGELERIALQVVSSIQTTGGGVSPPPPAFAVPPQHSQQIPTRPIVDPNLQRSSSTEEEMVRKQPDVIDRQQQIEEAALRRKLVEDAARNKAAAEAQQAYVRQQQEALEKQQRSEEERKRLEAERLRREEEEHQRRVAEQQAAEQRRRVEEQQRQQQEQWKQQQRNWQKQQTDEEQRRRVDELRMVEEKRRQDDAYRAQHQQWQQHQQQQHQQQTNGVPPNQWPHQHPSAAPPYGQQPQYGPGGQQGPPGHPGQPQPPPPQGSNSQVDQKYAKMASQVGDAGQQRSLQIIKHGVLVEWALQPPAMQILRPIEVLITSVHVVFPPKYGVPGHEHFKKWSTITLPEVLSGALPDDEKLSKAVKKLRFVLHPDKLPREFTDEQTYMCRMIWDIVSDAFEDHKKREEELAWMR